MSVLNFVRQCIDFEGFDGCFVDYSDFGEIKDTEFHRLRQAYLDAREALEEYVIENSDEDYRCDAEDFE